MAVYLFPRNLRTSYTPIRGLAIRKEREFRIL
jgi:hypothetical protein